MTSVLFLSQEDIPLYMEKQGKKLISKAFCPVIIVEDTYLQTLYDVVILLIGSYRLKTTVEVIVL